MPILKLTDEELDSYLYDLGLRSGHHVLVHSRLLALGYLQRGAASVFDALQNAIGPQGTLVVPAFNLYMPEGYIFDPHHTEPQGMGSLTNFIWNQGNWHRSACPIHSHLGVGKKANLLNTVSGNVSLGDGCDFQIFHEHGFHMLMLGVTFNEGASYMHYVEYTARVPYRESIQLPRRRKDAHGNILDIIVEYYGRPTADLRDGNKHRKYLENYNAVEELMTSHGLLTRKPCAYGYSTYMTVKDAHDCAMSMVRDAPYAMVLENPERA